MAEAEFKLLVVTNQRTVLDKAVNAITLPGEDGYFGVLAHHAPIIAVLVAGTVDIRIGTSTKRLSIGPGFFEMESNRATLLTDTVAGLDAEPAEE